METLSPQQPGVCYSDSQKPASFGRLTLQNRVSDSRGRFVVIIGPDGVGKTSVARRLIQVHGSPSMYVHFRPRILVPPPEMPGRNESPPPKRSRPSNLVFGWLRLLYSVPAFWLGYLRWIKPALDHGALVVGDRWGYGYIGQPVALGFRGPQWLAVAALRLLPRPDLIIRLRGDPNVIARRKVDLTAPEIAYEDSAWDDLPFKTLDLSAEQDVGDLARIITAELSKPAPRD